MKNISKYVVLLIILTLAYPGNAQEGDAIFNKILKEYTLNDDGSYEYREYKEIKLLSHMSFHRLYGETFVVYDPEYQKVVINEAYTIMRDGKKVVVPDNAFNEVLPRAARHSAPYNRLRELVITHTGLEVGATIFLDYTILTKEGFMHTFMGEEQIKDIVPIKEKKLVIHIPADQELHYKVLNIRTGPEISDGKGMKTYTFTFRGLAENVNLWGSDHELQPVVFFSTAKDLDRAYFPFVSQAAFTYPANEAMHKAASDVKATNDDELKAILAIQKMVVNEIGTWNIPLEYIAFKCRTPEETWKSNAGTPLEKTVLLATLLQKAGFRAVPVAIIPNKYYDKNVGSLYVFEGFAVQVASGKAPIYISATSTSTQDLGLSLEGRLLLVLDGAIESLKTYDPSTKPAEIIYHGNFSLKADQSLSGNLFVKLAGNVNPYFKLYMDSAYAKRYSTNVQEVKINTLEPQESIFDLTIEKENACEQYGDYVFMDIPSSRYGISSWGFSYIERGRQTPIKLNEVIKEEYHFVIKLPDGYELISPEVHLDVENNLGKLEISMRQKGNDIFITRDLRLKKDLIQYNEFDAFNALWKPWMNQSFTKIILKKTEK